VCVCVCVCARAVGQAGFVGGHEDGCRYDANSVHLRLPCIRHAACGVCVLYTVLYVCECTVCVACVCTVCRVNLFVRFLIACT